MTEPRERIDEAIEAMREQPVAWSEVREQRVFKAVLAQRAESGRPSAPPSWGWRVALVSSLVCLVGLVAMYLDGLGTRALDDPHAELPSGEVEPRAEQEAEELAEVAKPPRPARQSALQMSDGSIARFGPEAQVQLVTQGREQVVIEQHAGRVEYEVEPRPERSFEVLAGDVRVRVIGTQFVVDVSAEQIRVAVERGEVEVERGSARARLLPGESIAYRWSEAKPDEEPVPAAAPVPADDDAPQPPASEPGEPPSVDQLLAEANEARRLGEDARAARTLRELLQRYPKDNQASAAAFTLGLVEVKRGRLEAAREAFADSYARDPSGPLAESARVEEIAVLAKLGQFDAARTLAEAYLDAHPDSAHASRVRRIIE